MDWFLLMSTTAITGEEWEGNSFIIEKPILSKQLNEVFTEWQSLEFFSMNYAYIRPDLSVIIKRC